MPLEYNFSLTPAAKNLRRAMTPQERKLWYVFLSKQSLHFRRQKVIGNFIADFYCYQANLVLEIDGKQHYDEQGLAHDKERDLHFAALGLTVLRITNQDIDYDFANVCRKIADLLETCSDSGTTENQRTQSSVSPLGEMPEGQRGKS